MTPSKPWRPTPDDEALRKNPSEYDARLIAYFLTLRWRRPDV